jgi:hypothetical protein
MAKGKHPGMGDRPDIHGDTGEGIAAYAPPPKGSFRSVAPAAHLCVVQPEFGRRAMAEGGQGFKGGRRRTARGQLMMVRQLMRMNARYV